MGQPSADRQNEHYSAPQAPWSAQPGAVQPYSVQPYPGQPYPGQPYPAPISPFPEAPVGRLVSAGGRFGAFLLDVLLCCVTLGIGYLIWSLVTWSDGQTPAKKLLGHVVVDANTGVPFDWGRMALREFVIEGLLGGALNTISFGVYFWVDSLMILGAGQRTLHDRMANSVVRFI
jgi:uncharacterized RDD family membrane protein YckC